ncbi:MAG: hypothetical protein PHC53_01720 [Patescibacteria group bacterium]|nr:hypothetical protein [Patescibacteria group bacterium]
MSTQSQNAAEQSKKCPKCKEDIQLSANKCKHCGADLRNWFVRHKIITGILILFVIGLFGSAMDKGGTKPIQSQSPTSSSTQTTKTPKPTPKPAEPAVIKITADQLYSEYEANEVAADNAYKGKILEVSGKIDNIAKDILDNPYITLKTQVMFGSVQCFLKDSEQSKAATLKKGQNIVVRGKGSGQTLGNVMIMDCEIIQ